MGKLPKEEVADIARKTSQCVLLRGIDYIGDNVLRQPTPDDIINKVEDVQKNWGYKNFIKYNTDAPLKLISDLTSNPGMRPLLNIPGHILSALVPKMRIYKQVFKNKEDVDGEIIEFQFAGAYSPEDIRSITEGHAGRASAIGIKSFDWTYIGTNPAETKSNITARLVLHMQSIAILDEDKLSPSGKKYKYLDLLALPTTPYNKCVRKETGRDEYDNKQSRVYINVGWALPPNAVDILYNDYSNSNPNLPGDIKRIKEAISHANVDLYLNLAGHNITYNQDGTVELSIDYIAAADSLLNDLKANVFYLDPNYKNQVKQFEKNRKYINEKKRSIGKQKCQGATEPTLKEAGDELKKEEERKKEAEDSRKHQIYNSVIQHLKKNRQIYLLSVSKEIFVGAGERETTVEEANKKLQDTIRATVGLRPVAFSVSYNQDNIKEAQPQEKNGRKLIHYFFLGDLINAALGVLYDPELNLANPENFKVIVGPLSYYRQKRIGGEAQGDRERRVVNIADIPISLDLFNVFFNNRVVNSLIENYPVQQFLKDMVTHLIQPALDQACTGLGAFQQPRISFQTFASPIDLNKIQIKKQNQANKQIINGNVNVPIPPRLTGQQSDGGPFFNYFLMYVTSGDSSFLESEVSPTNPVPEDEDAKKGIFWLRTGMDKGMVKNIQFAKSDLPFAREARMRRSGSDPDAESILNSFTFIREKYNATITLFGTPNFFPGHIVYVDPFGLGTSKPEDISKISRFLGLGGYYVVISVDSSIENGSFQTVLKCEWISDGSALFPQLSLSGLNVDECCAPGRK